MSRIEDYALLSDCKRAALVSRDGAIDWLCLPRFDSPACFAALLGDEKNGTWKISPKGSFVAKRKYRTDSMILETTFENSSGAVVRLTDCLVVNESSPLLLRQVHGIRNKAAMQLLLNIRFDYGSIVPWLRKTSYGLSAVAGPDEVHVQSSVKIELDDDLNGVAQFEIQEGEILWFALSWNPEFIAHFNDIDNPLEKMEGTDQFWKQFSGKCTYDGPFQEAVTRSVLTLKSLTYEPTGGIVAAPTTSLPETLHGSRNWDYRYCWIRDSTFSMYALLTAGYRHEAECWRRWLMRAVAGMSNQVNIMYGLAGERRLTELQLPWLEGYEKSSPVRTGNAAYQQLQLDIFGEALDTLYLAQKSGIEIDENSWRIQEHFVDFIAAHWDQPDEGIWEIRGPKQHFTHSKVMAWVAVDRAIRSAETGKFKAPLQDWQRLRDRIHEDICSKGYNRQKNSFTQYYGADHLDASLLMIPIVGFLPPDDERVIQTVIAIEKELFRGDFVLRYETDRTNDGQSGREGAFLACSFWLVDCWVLMGRYDDAQKLFQKLISLANDVGLLSEEYDVHYRRLVGNFPQALSHISLINSAFNLQIHHGPARDRSNQIRPIS